MTEWLNFVWQIIYYGSAMLVGILIIIVLLLTGFIGIPNWIKEIKSKDNNKIVNIEDPNETKLKELYKNQARAKAYLKKQKEQLKEE